MHRYNRVKVLGRGGFGCAILVTPRDRSDLGGASQLVVKEVRLSSDARVREDARREAALLRTMRHPNIIGFVDSFVENECLYIVMEYADGGDLHGRIQTLSRTRSHMTENEALNIFTQICLGLKHMHDKHILHRDLKSQNVFLMRTGVVKLGDLGIAKTLSSSADLARTQIGTPYYLSPEICVDKPYGKKSDMWAAGVILYEMLTGSLPFVAPDLPRLVTKILAGAYPAVPTRYSEPTRKLVASLLSRDPRARPSVNAVLKSTLMRDRLAAFLTHTLAQREFGQALALADPAVPPVPRPPPAVAPAAAAPVKPSAGAAVSARAGAAPVSAPGSRGPSPSHKDASADARDSAAREPASLGSGPAVRAVANVRPLVSPPGSKEPPGSKDVAVRNASSEAAERAVAEAANAAAQAVQAAAVAAAAERARRTALAEAAERERLEVKERARAAALVERARVEKERAEREEALVAAAREQRRRLLEAAVERERARAKERAERAASAAAREIDERKRRTELAKKERAKWVQQRMLEWQDKQTAGASAAPASAEVVVQVPRARPRGASSDAVADSGAIIEGRPPRNELGRAPSSDGRPTLMSPGGAEPSPTPSGLSTGASSVAARAGAAVRGPSPRDARHPSPYASSSAVDSSRAGSGRAADATTPVSARSTSARGASPASSVHSARSAASREKSFFPDDAPSARAQASASVPDSEAERLESLAAARRATWEERKRLEAKYKQAAGASERVDSELPDRESSKLSEDCDTSDRDAVLAQARAKREHAAAEQERRLREAARAAYEERRAIASKQDPTNGNPEDVGAEEAAPAAVMVAVPRALPPRHVAADRSASTASSKPTRPPVSEVATVAKKAAPNASKKSAPPARQSPAVSNGRAADAAGTAARSSGAPAAPRVSIRDRVKSWAQEQAAASSSTATADAGEPVVVIYAPKSAASVPEAALMPACDTDPAVPTQEGSHTPLVSSAAVVADDARKGARTSTDSGVSISYTADPVLDVDESGRPLGPLQLAMRKRRGAQPVRTGKRSARSASMENSLFLSTTLAFPGGLCSAVMQQASAMAQAPPAGAAAAATLGVRTLEEEGLDVSVAHEDAFQEAKLPDSSPPAVSAPASTSELTADEQTAVVLEADVADMKEDIERLLARAAPGSARESDASSGSRHAELSTIEDEDDVEDEVYADMIPSIDTIMAGLADIFASAKPSSALAAVPDDDEDEEDEDAGNFDDGSDDDTDFRPLHVKVSLTGAS